MSYSDNMNERSRDVMRIRRRQCGLDVVVGGVNSRWIIEMGWDRIDAVTVAVAGASTFQLFAFRDWHGSRNCHRLPRAPAHLA